MMMTIMFDHFQQEQVPNTSYFTRYSALTLVGSGRTPRKIRYEQPLRNLKVRLNLEIEPESQVKSRKLDAKTSIKSKTCSTTQLQKFKIPSSMMPPSSTRFNQTLPLHRLLNRLKHQCNADKSKPRMIRKLRGDSHLGHLPRGVMMDDKESMYPVRFGEPGLGRFRSPTRDLKRTRPCVNESP